MRTTLSLDPDVAALLAEAQKSAKKPFKQVVNDALRAGLQPPAPARAKAARFRIRSADLGKCHLPSLDNIAEVLAVAEGEGHK